MRPANEKADVGVIVGRFQVNELHDTHKKLIQYVYDRHKRVIIFLGHSPLPCTQNNPLPYRSRREMIIEEFPHIDILYIKDINNDKIWSKTLDGFIEDQVGPNHSVLLYGGRNSFIWHYNGKHPTQELLQEEYISGSDVRQDLGIKTFASPDFRAGLIYATQNKYPVAIPTVDVAVLNSDETKVILVRKPNENKFRFPGGFCQPGESWEETAAREVAEETHISTDGIKSMKYIGSFPIDDWRYRNEIDKITTSFFKTTYMHGSPIGDDDVEEAKWFEINKLRVNDFVPEHKILFQALTENINFAKYISTFESNRPESH